MLPGQSAQPGETSSYPEEAHLRRPTTMAAAQESDMERRMSLGRRLLAASGGRVCHGAMFRM